MPAYKAIGIQGLAELALAEEAHVYIGMYPDDPPALVLEACRAPSLLTLRAVGALAQAVNNEFVEH